MLNSIKSSKTRIFWLQFVAKKLDKRLSTLGATPIIERGLGDDQHPSGYHFHFWSSIHISCYFM